MWQASAGQRLWTAVSSTRRTPTITDRDFRANFSVIPGPALPILVGVSGSPEYDAEEFVQAEAGYRILIGSSATLDAVAFSGSYDGLRTFEPIAPAVEPTPAPVHVLAGVELANLLNARMSGVELSARWTPVPPWQLEASYSLLHLTADLDPASLDSTSVDTDGNAPRHQWHVRSTISLRPGLQVGASISRVGGLRKPDVLAYTRLDARAELRLTSRLTAAAVAQNLLTGHHQEFASDFLFLTSSVPRSARLDLRWEF
jgi:iron complex outermembrane receptor protein